VELAQQGFLQADVRTTIDTAGAGTGATKVVRVRIDPGPLATDRVFDWIGNDVVSDEALDAAVSAAGLTDVAWHEPAVLERVVRESYSAEGYLAAAAAAAEPVFENGRARLPVTIVEGPRARLSGVRYEGVHAFSQAALADEAALRTGAPVRPSELEAARARIERLYYDRGFNTARVDVDAAATDDGSVNAVVRVAEGPQQLLRSVDVQGAPHTHPGLVASALKLDPGTPLDAEALYEARRRLYETGAFRQVDVQTVPQGEPERLESGVLQQAVTARIALDEWPLWRLRYGLQVNDTLDTVTDTRDVGPGVVLDVERRNLFGRAASIGIATRYEDDRQAARSYFSTPRLFRLPITTSFFAQKEWQTVGGADTHAATVSLEQRYRFRGATQVNYGWFYRRTVTELEFLGDAIEIAVNYSGLYSAVSFDRRDDPFDARRGWFHSSALKYASETLGSDVRFLKGVVQQSWFQPAGGATVALNARVGLADGFGQELLTSERFYAGGVGSVRGYREDSLTPVDVAGVPLGGEALVVLNGELRFPIWNRLRGVGFVDAGNTFAGPSRIDLGDLAVGAGVGLRVMTPVGLLRLDYGVPVSREAGPGSGRWYFSFGQVF
jgi:outer membrane protein assembly factor BamA